jgi:bifunctional DNA-binding transcriptional regulator/antitoxin component of YhaV-PrlF toxin-antitoxin module
MEITKVLDEGQVIISESLIRATGWEVGQELVAINTGDGILLKLKKPFAETSLQDVAGCLKYEGTPKTLEDMENAIRLGVEDSLK